MKNLAQPSPSPRLGGVCVTLSAVALVLFRSVSNAQQNEPRNVSVCQLVDSPKEFNGKYVRVRAQVSSDGIERTNLKDDACRKGVALWIPQDVRKDPDILRNPEGNSFPAGIVLKIGSLNSIATHLGSYANVFSIEFLRGVDKLTDGHVPRFVLLSI